MHSPSAQLSKASALVCMTSAPRVTPVDTLTSGALQYARDEKKPELRRCAARACDTCVPKWRSTLSGGFQAGAATQSTLGRYEINGRQTNRRLKGSRAQLPASPAPSLRKSRARWNSSSLPKSSSGPRSAAACAAWASSAPAAASTVASAAARARRRRRKTSRQSADVRALDSRRPVRLPLEPLRRSTVVPPMLRRSELRWRLLVPPHASSSNRDWPYMQARSVRCCNQMRVLA